MEVIIFSVSTGGRNAPRGFVFIIKKNRRRRCCSSTNSDSIEIVKLGGISRFHTTGKSWAKSKQTTFYFYITYSASLIVGTPVMGVWRHVPGHSTRRELTNAHGLSWRSYFTAKGNNSFLMAFPDIIKRSRKIFGFQINFRRGPGKTRYFNKGAPTFHIEQSIFIFLNLLKT